MAVHSSHADRHNPRTAVISRIHAILPRLPLSVLESIEDCLQAEQSAGDAVCVSARFTLTVQEARLLETFRLLEGDEQRDSVLEALLMVNSTRA